MPFQSVVNYEQTFGFPGAQYDNFPARVIPAELVSSNAAYNIVGATAYTATTADPGDNSASFIAAAGGTGVFAGILVQSTSYATFGGAAGPLSPSLTLPNYTIGELATFGNWIVSIPGPAAIGDLVAYDTITGALSTYKATTIFTGAIAASTGVLTVSALTQGQIQVGQVISGTGIPPGTYIVSAGTGLGGTGTYNTNYTGGAISSTTITAPSLPPAAASFTGAISTAGVLTVSGSPTGTLAVGQVIYGAGVPANTVITSLGTGVGGTGTYNLSQSPAVAITAETMTADALAQVPNASVYQFSAAGATVGVIRL